MVVIATGAVVAALFGSIYDESKLLPELAYRQKVYETDTFFVGYVQKYNELLKLDITDFKRSCEENAAAYNAMSMYRISSNTLLENGLPKVLDKSKCR